jgi:hypothetical protein
VFINNLIVPFKSSFKRNYGMNKLLRLLKTSRTLFSCSWSYKMAGYFCFCFFFCFKENIFSVSRLVSIWVCGETDVNQTLFDTRGKGRVGNEMEDVIKGIRWGGGCRNRYRCLVQYEWKMTVLKNFPDENGPRNEVGRKDRIRRMLHFFRLTL